MDRYTIRQKITVCPSAGVQTVEMYFFKDTVCKSRAEKVNTTSLAVKKMNNKYSRQEFESLIVENYGDGDYFLTVTFPKNLTDDERKKELKSFIVRLRQKHKKKELELRYIYVSEIGEKDRRLHFHIFVNGGLMFNEIEEVWNKSAKLHGTGNIDIKSIKRNSDGIPCARYLQKQWQFREDHKRKWVCSQNIRRPEIIIEDDVVTAQDFKRISEEYDEKTIKKLFPYYELNKEDGCIVTVNDVTASKSVFLRLHKSDRTSTYKDNELFSIPKYMALHSSNYEGEIIWDDDWHRIFSKFKCNQPFTESNYNKMKAETCIGSSSHKKPLMLMQKDLEYYCLDELTGEYYQIPLEL